MPLFGEGRVTSGRVSIEAALGLRFAARLRPPVISYGNTINSFGRLVDLSGRAIDSFGRLVDSFGSAIDSFGSAISSFVSNFYG